MRLDAFLKKSLLIKRRELAHQLCEEGMAAVEFTYDLNSMNGHIVFRKP